MTEKRVWNPLESDPEILSEVAAAYGVDNAEFSEIYSDELLDMIPRPVEAVVLLFPITENINKLAENDTISQDTAQELFFMPQRISNACGTMAILHTFLNTRSHTAFRPDSPFHKLTQQITPSTSPVARAEAFEAIPEFETIHQQYAQQGQTRVEDHVGTEVHYITFIHHNGRIYELDGRKTGPVDHGLCSPDELLPRGFAIMKTFMEAETGNPQFAALAISHLE